MEIRRITEVEAVKDAGLLFDAPPLLEATERFLADERHHLLIAYVDDVPAGMVTGVEMTHPDKGTEMFLYELGVEESFRGRGVGRGELCYPLAGRIRGDAENVDAPGGDLHDEEDVEAPQKDGVHVQEVASEQRVGLGAKECVPGLLGGALRCGW
ncbi:GNAT family N-acetyltransferase [Streptantibioticus rubrisoli]|uniref:GNAT family N-acetyltransferase n=1 Tax=Streptantibioticus rubrisoli TaxID=1387313 RepID=A0ABT1PIC8_9ACTN|nr:GNAT family N-acetyltransferase [Streptantibioticus rubrisoli]MCQ4045115.1 GNAT family N-acetyltransferase [Streptantibioticus rubrisoli]